jgi:hypothetical protein
MSKKDYVLLAQALKIRRDELNTELCTVQGLQVTESVGKRKEWANMVNLIADTFAGDNPRFNRAKFLQACGYND